MCALFWEIFRTFLFRIFKITFNSLLTEPACFFFSLGKGKEYIFKYILFYFKKRFKKGWKKKKTGMKATFVDIEQIWEVA